MMGRDSGGKGDNWNRQWRKGDNGKRQWREREIMGRDSGGKGDNGKGTKYCTLKMDVASLMLCVLLKHNALTLTRS